MNAKRWHGTVIAVCPKCRKILSEKEVIYTLLDAWCFKNGVCVTFDGKGCCH